MATLISSSISASVTASSTIPTPSFPTSSANPELSNPNNHSKTLTTLVALGCALFFVGYLCGIALTWRYLRHHPRAVNKKSGDLLGKWGPAFYMLVVLVSLIEVSLASWLVLEYTYYYDAPNKQAYAAANFLIFDSAWTALTSGVYSILFLHPTWALLPVASIGSQCVWLFVTWLLWIVGAGLLNGALPALIDMRKCQAGVVFCSQIQGLFGLAIVQILILTGGIATLIWLVVSASKSDLNYSKDAPVKNTKSSAV